MNKFVWGLFTDLHNRIDKMTTYLNTLGVTSKVASDYKKDTVAMLEDINAEIREVIQMGVFEHPRFTRNLIIKYNTVESQFMDIELVRYLAISKYDEKADGYFEKLLERIYKKIDFRQKLPFVSTFSNSDTYYWAETVSGMIALPQGEEKNLLNLSDLYHEIGHFCYAQHAQDLLGDFLKRVTGYYDEKKQASFQLAKPALKKWETDWAEEFTCDMIATFLAGPAYAWTNLKICTISSSAHKLFGHPELKSVHPANEARKRAICCMLRLTGHADELEEVERVWNELTSNTSNRQFPGYDNAYPQELIEVLVKNVHDGCLNIALRPYKVQLEKFGDPVSFAVNQAWDCMRTNPDGFLDWEQSKIKDLGYIM